jgi:hypothetical protein
MEERVRVSPRRRFLPVHLLPQALQRDGVEFERTIADPAIFQILEILVRETRPGEIVEARRVAEASGDAKAAASLELLDASHVIEIERGRRVHPDRTEHRHLGVAVGVEQLDHGCTGQQRRAIRRAAARLVSQEGLQFGRQ